MNLEDELAGYVSAAIPPPEPPPSTCICGRPTPCSSHPERVDLIRFACADPGALTPRRRDADGYELLHAWQARAVLELLKGDAAVPKPPVGDVLPRIGVQIMPPSEVDSLRGLTGSWGTTETVTPDVYAYVHRGEPVVEIESVRHSLDYAEQMAVRILSAVHWMRAQDPDARLRAGLPVPADGEG